MTYVDPRTALYIRVTFDLRNIFVSSSKKNVPRITELDPHNGIESKLQLSLDETTFFASQAKIVPFRGRKYSLISDRATTIKDEDPDTTVPCRVLDYELVDE
jgi:hypothetical protein